MDTFGKAGDINLGAAKRNEVEGKGSSTGAAPVV